MIPLVERARLVDTLIALQPYQARTGGVRHRPGQLRLAHTRRALHQ
ncbi:Uncharacterised protein [Mycobacteroides abscessus subsp. massiliense]|nr:Uncharacterised protein [Mycobacteroides abscessus subsp. massiliense]